MAEGSIRMLVDAGATKSHFVLLKERGVLSEFALPGLNANYSGNEEIMAVFSDAVAKIPKGESVDRIDYYGAGCATPRNAARMTELVRLFFPAAEVYVNSDLLAACRALSGCESSIVCILGTGSTSSLYDGSIMVKRAPSLGFMLGDEASGTCLGKLFVKEYLSGTLSNSARDLFENKTGLNEETVLVKLYKEPHPNRFLSSLAPLVKELENEKCVSGILSVAFDEFFKVHRCYYPKSSNMEWNFTGSIAENFKQHLLEAAEENNCKIGRIVPAPMPLLIKFHNNNPDLQ